MNEALQKRVEKIEKIHEIAVCTSIHLSKLSGAIGYLRILGGQYSVFEDQIGMHIDNFYKVLSKRLAEINAVINDEDSEVKQ